MTPITNEERMQRMTDESTELSELHRWLVKAIAERDWFEVRDACDRMEEVANAISMDAYHVQREEP